MNAALLEKIVHAVLYEGHILYPYRPSSQKNRQRFTFGRVYPRAYSLAQNGAEPCAMQTECLARAVTDEAALYVTVRFLQPMVREIGRGAGPEFELVPELRVAGRRYQAWHEAIERTVALPPLTLASAGRIDHPFHFAAETVREAIPGDDGGLAGVIFRRSESLVGRVELSAEPLADGVVKIRVRILNESTDDEPILRRLFASTHTILHVEGGEFFSLLDPPPEHAAAIAACQNIGSWPVLVGDEAAAERDVLLSSPIILYDYPKIAPESPGDLFDGLEIDEILTLRVMTMTDDEKAEMRAADPQARRILERTESLPAEELLRMHGTLRDVRASAEDFFNAPTPATVIVRGVSLKAGDRVRIHPKGRADVMDIALAGKIAIIEAVEHDVEDRIHFALVVEDDPGRELGMTRYPGHRFFYSAEEIEPLEAGI